MCIHMTDNIKYSCDVMSCQFCKLSYSKPPCCFNFTWSGKYNKMSGYFSLSSYHNSILRLSDKNIQTQYVKMVNLAMQLVKSTCNSLFCCFSYTVSYKRETKERGKIMPVPRRVKPLLGFIIAHRNQVEIH